MMMTIILIIIIITLFITDVDECKENKHNCDQICVNVPGRYECRCEMGYRLDMNGRTCLGQYKGWVGADLMRSRWWIGGIN